MFRNEILDDIIGTSMRAVERLVSIYICPMPLLIRTVPDAPAGALNCSV